MIHYHQFAFVNVHQFVFSVCDWQQDFPLLWIERLDLEAKKSPHSGHSCLIPETEAFHKSNIGNVQCCCDGNSTDMLVCSKNMASLEAKRKF